MHSKVLERTNSAVACAGCIAFPAQWTECQKEREFVLCGRPQLIAKFFPFPAEDNMENFACCEVGLLRPPSLPLSLAAAHSLMRSQGGAVAGPVAG